MRGKRQQRGYTLLELLVVIAMMGVLSTMMTQIWFELMGGHRISKVRMTLERNTQNAFETMRADFDMALSTAAADGPLVGTRSLEESVEAQLGSTVTLKRLASDSVSFATRRPNIDGQLAAQRVTYRIKRPKAPEGDEAPVSQDPVLMRAWTPLDEAAGEGGEYSVLDGATEMLIEYWDGGEWHDEWSGETNPEAVRVSLTAMVPLEDVWADELDEAVSRVAVFPLRTP